MHPNNGVHEHNRLDRWKPNVNESPGPKTNMITAIHEIRDDIKKMRKITTVEEIKMPVTGWERASAAASPSSVWVRPCVTWAAAQPHVLTERCCCCWRHSASRGGRGVGYGGCLRRILVAPLAALGAVSQMRTRRFIGWVVASGTQVKNKHFGALTLDNGG